jgi:REP element-mobilizing transposase RayT
LRFLEIGTEGDHVHFLVQSVPAYSPTKIVTTIRSILARKIFERNPEVKKQLWGGELWTDGHFISTVSKHGNEGVITNYVKLQGTAEHYKQVCKMRNNNQLSLFD